MFVEYIYIYMNSTTPKWHAEILWNWNISFQLKKKNTYQNGIDNLNHNSPGTNYLCEKPKTPFLHVITVSCQIKWTKLIDTREPACGSRRNKGLVSRHPSRAQSETCRTIMPLQGNGRSCLKKASPIIKIYLVNYFYIRMFLYFKNIFFYFKLIFLEFLNFLDMWFQK